jgi:AsmA protein
VLLREKSMSRTRRISLTIGVVAVVVAALTPFLIRVNQFRATIEERASAALGRKVELGRLSLSVSNGSLSAESLTVADDPAFSTSPFLTARSVKVGVKLWPLIVSQSHSITDITIENPEVIVFRNSAGEWNYSSLGSSSASSDVSIGKLELRDGRVIVGAPTSQTRSLYDHVHITASNVSLASACPVSATAALPGGGTFTFAGTMGPLDRADASLTPLAGTIAVERLNLATTGFLHPSAGLGGLLDLKATIASRNDEAAVAGSATVSKALLVAGGSPAAQPVVVEFDTTYNRRKRSGVLNRSTLKIGGATARLNGTYDLGGAHTVVGVNMAGEHMPARELERFLPALGIHLPRGASLAAGTAAMNLHAVGALNRLVTTGNVGLLNAKLAGFDLGANARAIAAFAGVNTGRDLDIETLTTTLRIAPDGLRFDHFNAVVRSLGLLTGAGTIDARNRLDFKMVATLTDLFSGGAGKAVGTAGTLDELLDMLTGRDVSRDIKGQRIPFLIQGTTSNPEFLPDVGGLVLQTLEQQLRKQGADPFGALAELFKVKKP